MRNFATETSERASERTIDSPFQSADPCVRTVRGAHDGRTTLYEAPPYHETASLASQCIELPPLGRSLAAISETHAFAHKFARLGCVLTSARSLAVRGRQAPRARAVQVVPPHASRTGPLSSYKSSSACARTNSSFGRPLECRCSALAVAVRNCMNKCTNKCQTQVPSTCVRAARRA